MGIKHDYPEGAKTMKDLQKEIDFGEAKYTRKGKATSRGQANQQDKGGIIHVTMEAHAKLTQKI
eukprot:1486939-Pyramimonas_sp.AAC.1